MQIGYIYIITNLINNNCYIGQTSKTIEERFREHKTDSLRKDRSNYEVPLYRAFRKYGLENFKIEEIEKCEISKLNEREIYWISFFDTYHNGYNATLGGDGTRTLELNEKFVLNKYEELKTVSDVANFFNCSVYSISNILKKHDINIKTPEEHAKENGTKIQRLDANSLEILEEYDSLHDAGQWVLDNHLSNAKNRKNCAIAIRYAIVKQKISYNYLWRGNIKTKKNVQEYLIDKKKYDKKYKPNKSKIKKNNIKKDIKDIPKKTEKSKKNKNLSYLWKNDD